MKLPFSDEITEGWKIFFVIVMIAMGVLLLQVFQAAT